MATIADTGFPTLQTVVNHMQPDGAIADVVNVLTKKTPLLEDMPFIEANSEMGHIVTQQSLLATPSWRKANAGVAPTKAEAAQYVEALGMLEDWSDIDEKVAALNGNSAAFRRAQDNAKLEGFRQEVNRAVFYESSITNPERIHGLASRYAASSGYTTSSYVLPKGTLSGVNCESVWLINWDPTKVTGLYPKGSQAGLKVRDFGALPKVDANGNEFIALRTNYQWQIGLGIFDYRYCARLQWDPDDSTNFPDSGKAFYLGLCEMMDTVYDLQPSARFYMSRTSVKKLDAQLASNSQNYLQWVDMGGRRVRSFLGVPVRVTDSLVGESAIS
jgi:hypothetical protein